VSLDIAALKARQQATWALGDFSVIGATIQSVAEELCSAVDLRAGSDVLDVACGHGNAALAAARHFCRVRGVDFVPELLERARERARAERLEIEFALGDAEALAFPDASFDCVLSTFGVMFAPRQELVASELLRVLKPGGRIGLANWTAEGLIGDVFRVLSRFAPPPAGVASPFAWGSERELARLFGPAANMRVLKSEFAFRYRSPEHWVEVFRTWYGPTKRVFDGLDEPRRIELSNELCAALSRQNRAHDGTLIAPSEYVEVVIEKPR
jgi:ubiquinone/menaquinone biosynthesis C-methylase UbiE